MTSSWAAVLTARRRLIALMLVPSFSCDGMTGQERAGVLAGADAHDLPHGSLRQQVFGLAP
ncbi:MAG TPA: hypothetical protein VMK12_09900 [Anaeromyxobacteraceae bacterium]|nr:hypothetical protein [Anaeromyxobacteraceae bacterium]